MQQIESTILGILMDVSVQDDSGKAFLFVEKYGLAPELFVEENHSNLFRAIHSLVSRNRPVNPQAFQLEIKKLFGENSYLLIEPYLEALRQSQEFAFGETALPQFVEELKTSNLARKVKAFSDSIAEKNDDPKISKSALLEEVRKFSELSVNTDAKTESLSDFSDEYIQLIQDFEEGNKELLLPLGVSPIDQEIGGLRNTLTVWGGLPGTGKSALTATVLGNWAKQGIKCGFFSLEDNAMWVHERLAARESKIELSRIFNRDPEKQLSREEKAKHHIANGVVREWLKNVKCFFPNGRLKPTDLVAKAKDWIINHKIKAIIIDHIGELDHGTIKDRRDLSVGDALSAIRSLAEVYQIPIVAIAHFNREADRNNGKPLLSHFAESAYIERMARLVLGIWQGTDENEMSVSVLKYTLGKAGMTINVPRLSAHALVSTGPALKRVPPLSEIRNEIWGNR